MNRLRRAEFADADLLYTWANDPITREMSFHTAPIPYETHLHWFTERIKDNDCYLYILEHNGQEAGTVRLDPDADNDLPHAYRLSYSLSPAYRGQGLGTVLLSLAEEAAKRDIPDVRYLTGSVKPENIASVKCFQNLHYRRFEQKTSQSFQCFTFFKELASDSDDEKTDY